MDHLVDIEVFGNSDLHLLPWSVFQLETMEHQKISRIIELLPIIGTLSP